MNVKPMPFCELRTRLEIDLIDGCIEISDSNSYLRGTLEEIDWGHPAPQPSFPMQINWFDEHEWDGPSQQWIMTKSENSFEFERGDNEFFTGPFLDQDTGHIFLVKGGVDIVEGYRLFSPETIYITFYPKWRDIPDSPRPQLHYRQLIDATVQQIS